MNKSLEQLISEIGRDFCGVQRTYDTKIDGRKHISTPNGWNAWAMVDNNCVEEKGENPLEAVNKLYNELCQEENLILKK